MRNLLVLIIPLWLLSCSDNNNVDGFDVRNFYPHQARSYHLTPMGHYRDAGPFASVAGGYVTEDDIDNAVDRGYSEFAVDFPELPAPSAYIDITDDYVMYVPNAGWASGADYGTSPVYVCLWSRGHSSIDPGAEFIKRAPNQNHSDWQFNIFPLLPALEHELLHTIIGDPGHSSSLWQRIR